jgi:hypothetical protein
MDGAFVQRGFKPDPYGPGYIGMTSTMFSMFTGDVESQPLNGDQMLWTRQDGEIFIIYSMRIAANGHFSLWRYAFTPAENGLGLDIEMRRHGEETINDRAMLELQ